jgi:hypothetical protein
MMSAAVYADIRLRLAEAPGPDRNIDVLIARALFTVVDRSQITGVLGDLRIVLPPVKYGPYEKSIPPFTASLDAALALVEEKLPGWWGSVDFGDWGDNPVRARLNLKENHAKANGEGATPALAVLSALFAALEAQHG